MKLKDLAAGLGISAAMVTKLKQRGMPTTSVEAAAKWRRRHLETARMKEHRPDTARRTPTSGHVSAPPPANLIDGKTARGLLQVKELGLLGLDALGRGTFGAVAPLLRQAMAQVPPGCRDQVLLPVEVWDALTCSIPIETAATPGAPIDGDESPLDEDFMGAFWYQIALSEHADMHLIPKARKASLPGDGGEDGG